jgi:hypothetical protein
MASEARNMNTTLPDLRDAERQQIIAAIAFELWLNRGFRSGSPARDWLRAQRKVTAKAGGAKIRRTMVGDYLVA